MVGAVVLVPHDTRGADAPFVAGQRHAPSLAEGLFIHGRRGGRALQQMLGEHRAE